MLCSHMQKFLHKVKLSLLLHACQKHSLSPPFTPLFLAHPQILCLQGTERPSCSAPTSLLSLLSCSKASLLAHSKAMHFFLRMLTNSKKLFCSFLSSQFTFTILNGHDNALQPVNRQPARATTCASSSRVRAACCCRRIVGTGPCMSILLHQGRSGGAAACAFQTVILFENFSFL